LGIPKTGGMTIRFCRNRLTQSTALLIVLGLSSPAGAKADILRLTCGKTKLTIDTVRPSVVMRFSNGFSQTYENVTRNSSYQYLDGTANPYKSRVTVTIDDKDIGFSENYQSAAGVNVIKNILDRKTSILRSDQNGRTTETQCVGQ
jgi:hypothetical protein